MTIRALSFDFDGCLFHRNYCQEQKKDVVKLNLTLLDNIKLSRKDNEQFITLVGSNRQSRNIDLMNSLGKGSCFPAIQKISDYLGAQLDKYLLADTYGKLPSGSSFDKAMEEINKGEYSDNHAEWLFDDSKGTLLYAQIQRLANQHPNEEIVFEFYDDRGLSSRNILEPLKDLFNEYPNLLPNNVTLLLHHYAGFAVTNIAKIVGTGIIDENYEQTIQDMVHIAEQNGEELNGQNFNTVKYTKPDLLINRRPLNVENVIPTISVNIINQIDDDQKQDDRKDGIIKNIPNINEQNKAIFFEKLQAIKTKAEALERDGHKVAANTAFEFYNTVNINADEYFNNKITYEQFYNTFNAAIDKARPELEKHRGWKQLLGNVGLAFLGIGLFYIAAGLINKAVTGNFLFFKATDSAEKLDNLENALKGVAPEA